MTTIHEPLRARCYAWGPKNQLLVDQTPDGRFEPFFSSGRPYENHIVFPSRTTFAVAQADLDGFAKRYGLRIVAEARACRVCGCRDEAIRDSCLDDQTGEPCHWVEEDLCSACEGKDECRKSNDEGNPKPETGKLTAES